jgi:hypothetical protein
MPLYSQSAASQGVCPDSLHFLCFHFRLIFESIKELGSTSQILFPQKDSMFLWPHFLFIHLGYGLILPCQLVVEGQVHDIGQIMLSLVNVLNTL